MNNIMKKICVIGGGEAGISLVESLRETLPDLQITLVEKRPYYLASQEVIDYCCGVMRGNIVSLDEFCRQNKINFLNDKVERINPRKKKVFLKGGGSFEFDMLVVCTGLKSRNLSIKGDFREGFFYLSDIDPVAVKDMIRMSQDIILYAGTFLGVKFAFYLSGMGKDIKLISGDLSFLGEFKERVITFLRERRVDVYEGCVIEEAIGEGRVKATRVSLPKIFSSQLVFVDSGFVPERGLFDEDVIVKDTFFTDYDDVYLVGDVNNTQIITQHFFLFNQLRAKKQVDGFIHYLKDGEKTAFDEQEFSPGDGKEMIVRFLESAAVSPR